MTLSKKVSHCLIFFGAWTAWVMSVISLGSYNWIAENVNSINGPYTYGLFMERDTCSLCQPNQSVPPFLGATRAFMIIGCLTGFFACLFDVLVVIWKRSVIIIGEVTGDGAIDIDGTVKGEFSFQGKEVTVTSEKVGANVKVRGGIEGNGEVAINNSVATVVAGQVQVDAEVDGDGCITINGRLEGKTDVHSKITIRDKIKVNGEIKGKGHLVVPSDFNKRNILQKCSFAMLCIAVFCSLTGVSVFQANGIQLIENNGVDGTLLLPYGYGLVLAWCSWTLYLFAFPFAFYETFCRTDPKKKYEESSRSVTPHHRTATELSSSVDPRNVATSSA